MDYLMRIVLLAIFFAAFLAGLPYYDSFYLHEAAHALVILALICFIPSLWDAFFPPPSKEQIHASRESSGRLAFFDVVRGVAIIAVVSVHILYVYLRNHVSNDIQFLHLFVFLRFAIPVFIVSSGVLLDPNKVYSRGLWKFYSSKVIRIFIPYVVFTAAIAAYAVYAHNTSFAGNFLHMLWTASAMEPYYFVAVLIQLYLLYPFIVRFRDSRRFLIGSFVFSLACFIAPSGWFGAGLSPAFFGQYLFFFVYGMYYRTDLQSGKPQKEYLKPLAFLVAAYPVLYLLYPGFYVNSTIFFGIVVFRLAHILYYLYWRKENWLRRFLGSYGRISLWIFLAHFPLSYLFFDLVVNDLGLEYHVGIITACIMAIVVNYPLAFLLDLSYRWIVEFFTGFSLGKRLNKDVDYTIEND